MDAGSSSHMWLRGLSECFAAPGSFSSSFTFNSSINGVEGVQMWLKPADEADADELTALFEEYGFEVDAYDKAEGGDDDE